MLTKIGRRSIASQIAGQCNERSINHAAKYVSSLRFLSTTRGGCYLRRAASASSLLNDRRHCSRCPCLTTLAVEPASPYFGTEILFSSKGVANTAILNSSSAAFGLIPPSRFLSILNHLSIPTRATSGLPRIDAFFIRFSSLRYGSQLAGTLSVVG